MKKIKIVKLILGMIVFVILTASFPYFFKSKEAIKLKVGILPIVDCLQLFVAKEKGFFRQENLEVETITMAGGAVIAPAVNSGELDIGFSNVLSIIIAHEEGFDFKFLTPGSFHDSSKGVITHQLLVPKNSQVFEPKNLEGKIVAINTLANINELVLRAWADKNKVDVDKITLVETPFPHMESLLETRQIDAAIVNEPFVTLSLLHGVAKILDEKPFDAISGRLMIASWFAKESRINQAPKKIKAFIRAIDKATKFIIAHSQEIPEMVSKNTRLAEELSGQIHLPIFKPDIHKEDLQVMIESAFKYGFIKEKFDAREITIDELKLK